MQRQNQGFTLVEMIVTITILAILASIAYPSYRNYQLKAREQNARADLIQNVSRLERYYAINKTFSGYSEDLVQNKSVEYFTLSGTYESDHYFLTATPKANSGEEKSIVYDSVRGMLLCWGENNSSTDANNSSAGASNLSHWANCKPF